MIVHLDDTVAAALNAVAAVDDTPPDMLAGMVVADWLATVQPRFTAAAAALDALAGNTQVVAPWQARVAEQLVPDAASATAPPPNTTDDDLEAAPPAGADDTEDLDAEPDVHACDHCDRTFTTPQGLGGHRRIHNDQNAKVETTSVQIVDEREVQDDAAPPGRCAHCLGIRMGDHHVDGEPACTGCWRDAGRPR